MGPPQRRRAGPLEGPPAAGSAAAGYLELQWAGAELVPFGRHVGGPVAAQSPSRKPAQGCSQPTTCGTGLQDLGRLIAALAERVEQLQRSPEGSAGDWSELCAPLQCCLEKLDARAEPSGKPRAPGARVTIRPGARTAQPAARGYQRTDTSGRESARASGSTAPEAAPGAPAAPDTAVGEPEGAPAAGTGRQHRAAGGALAVSGARDTTQPVGMLRHVLCALSSAAYGAAVRAAAHTSGGRGAAGERRTPLPRPRTSGLFDSLRQLPGAFMEGYREGMAKHRARQAAAERIRRSLEARQAVLTPSDKQREAARFLTSEVVVFRVAAHSPRAWMPVCRAAARAGHWAMQCWDVAYMAEYEFATELQGEVMVERPRGAVRQAEPLVLFHAMLEIEDMYRCVDRICRRTRCYKQGHAPRTLRYLIALRFRIYGDLVVELGRFQTLAAANIVKARETAAAIVAVLGPE
eukprot:TRINITY_DN23720_c0_g2_i1.p1 TRINITY_DN23720_c0_g2~~TRINITY_DN23720_c0_g2_i1.p1  ORF type:complete len:464 (+),score=29.00 TRINITY_DN23720_c0_g2_i1:78-1469(+)